MSQVSFKGNIGKIHGLKFSNDGKPRFSFSVAEGHGKFDKQSNEWRDTGVTWFNVTVFGREAESLAEVIQEGAKQRVLVQGRQETREYEVDGQKRTSLDVVADIVGIIPSANRSDSNTGGNAWGNKPANDPWTGQPTDSQAPAPF